MEGVGLDSIFKEMETVRRIGERANPVAGSYQSRGNVTARIAKGACDDVQLIRCQGITLSDRREPEAVFSQRCQPTARRIPVVDGYHCGSPDSFVHAIELPWNAPGKGLAGLHSLQSLSILLLMEIEVCGPDPVVAAAHRRYRLAPAVERSGEIIRCSSFRARML